MISNILIVTQTPPSMKRHPGGDRGHGRHQARAKISSELAEVINDGLFYYEQEELVQQDVQVITVVSFVLYLSKFCIRIAINYQILYML